MKLAVRLASSAASMILAGAGAAGGARIVGSCEGGSARTDTSASSVTPAPRIGAIDRGATFETMSGGQATSPVVVRGHVDQETSAAATTDSTGATGGVGSAHTGTDAGGSVHTATPPSGEVHNFSDTALGANGGLTASGGSAAVGTWSATASGTATLGSPAGAGSHRVALTGDATTSSTLTIGGTRG